MEKASVVVADILQELTVQAAEQPIESVDFNTVVRYMNRYMSQLAVTIPLGYTSVTSPDDLITIPDGAINGLIFNVAIQIANTYGIQPTAFLVKNAKDSLNIMRKIARNTIVSELPQTLPIGSGNEFYSCNSKFYKGAENAVSTEQSGTILTEGQ